MKSTKEIYRIAVEYYETREGLGKYAIVGMDMDQCKPLQEQSVTLVELDFDPELCCWTATNNVKIITLQEFFSGYKTCGTTFLY